MNESPKTYQSFRQIFDYYYLPLCMYAKRFIPELNIREDLVQDVFCSIWLKREQIDFSHPMKNYLMTCVRNECLNYLRNQEKKGIDFELNENIPIYSENHEELFLIQEFEELLVALLKEMPEEYRIAFELSRFENKPSPEIAEIMGVSVRTVERYRNRAIEILKKELKDYFPLFLFYFTNLYN